MEAGVLEAMPDFRRANSSPALEISTFSTRSYAALHRREDHRVIHATARAQSYRSARDADKPYF